MPSRRLIVPVFIFISVILMACTPQRDAGGVRLVSEVTAPSTNEPLPTLIITDTPVRMPEVASPLERVTVDAEFVLITPTLPPSKTPTTTPTHTTTPTTTPILTITATPNATAFLFPTSVIVPVTQVVAAPVTQVCDSSWTWIQPPPPNCPLNDPIASQGVFQQFQNGYMVWVGSLNLIYIMYSDGQAPRWMAYRDYFVEGMAETAGEYNNAPAPNLWQPRRGFGLLWRSNPAIRNRIGWAVQEWEQPYSVQIQRAVDGTIYISQPYPNTVFMLFANNTNWQQYGINQSAPLVPIAPSAPDGMPMPPPLPTLRPTG